MKNPRVWLLTTAFVVAPLVGLGMVLYGLGKLTVRRPASHPDDPYTDWLAPRENGRARTEHKGGATTSAENRS